MNQTGYRYGFRIYDARIAKFLSVNPLTKDYPQLTAYQYASNTPIMAIDMDGLECFTVHGTWSNPSTFTALSQENFKSIIDATKNSSVVMFQWTGNNADKYRKRAAKELVNKILAERKKHPSEPITIVGHSHGGNVGIMAANILNDMGVKVDNLITINTPVREYKLNENTPTRHINIYNTNDVVQVGGGNLFRIPDSKSSEGWNYEGATKGISGEYGGAGRIFDNAVNIEVNAPEGFGVSAHNSHNHPELWRDKLKDIFGPIDLSKFKDIKVGNYKSLPDNTRVSSKVVPK